MPNAWIDIGTLWSDSSRFCAVTMISSLDAPAASCAIAATGMSVDVARSAAIVARRERVKDIKTPRISDVCAKSVTLKSLGQLYRCIKGPIER